MKYGDLNLKEIRDKNGLDFAHYTYKRGQCSCCYGPQDMARRYWKNGIIREDDNYTFILFKNAYNGRGIVKKEDEVEDRTCIEWRMSKEQLIAVCRDLQSQLGEEYSVKVPESEMICIIIHRKS